MGKRISALDFARAQAYGELVRAVQDVANSYPKQWQWRIAKLAPGLTDITVTLDSREAASVLHVVGLMLGKTAMREEAICMAQSVEKQLKLLAKRAR
jgi:hypothetical protein